MRKIPLNALRVFEAAARHENFSKAAEELLVTQSAVSKQVALLEDYLDCTLFTRDHRFLKLTEKGRFCAQVATDCLTTLSSKLDEVKSFTRGRITVLVDVDFAQLWLFPRLPEFEKLHPNVTVSVRTKMYRLDPSTNERFDIAVSWGRGNWKQHIFEPLFTNQVFPVCSPEISNALALGEHQITGADLIHERTSQWWSIFSKKLGLHGLNLEICRYYNQTILCLEAAARGDGIAVGDEVLARPYLEDGRLVIPFSESLPTPESYYILTPRNETSNHEYVELFRKWLHLEASRHRQWITDFGGNLDD